MKHILLLFILQFFIIHKANASFLKTVDLIYDKNEVYAGNQFKIILKATDTKDKTFYSDKQVKYNLYSFIISSSDNITIVNHDEYLLVKVHEGHLEDKIQINLKYRYGNKQTFNFSFGLKFTSIESINISNINQINENSLLDFKLTTVSISGITKEIINAELIYDNIQFSVIEGDAEIKKTGHVYIENYNYCKPTVTIKAELKNDPSIYVIKSFKTQKMNKANFISLNKTRQRNEMTIKTSLVYDKCLKDNLLNVDIYDVNNLLIRNYKLALKDDVLIIDVSGVDGEIGKNGKNGTYKVIDGGNGTDGTDGYNGKNVFIYYTTRTLKYKSKIVVLSNGGRGGRYGKGGKPSRKNEKDNDITRTITGINGKDGRDGRDGVAGKVYYIYLTK